MLLGFQLPAKTTASGWRGRNRSACTKLLGASVAAAGVNAYPRGLVVWPSQRSLINQPSIAASLALSSGSPSNKCDNVSCTLSCCDPEQHRGWASWSATDQRKYLRRCHDQYREAYVSNGGHHGVSAFLRNYLVKPTCHQLNVNAALRGRQCITVAQGFTKGGCSWCNTLPGDIQRNHKFTFKQCPKFFEGNTFILTSVIPHTQYVLPPMESNQMPLRVSRSFWCSTFLVSYLGKKLRRLVAGPTVCNFNFLVSLQGKHGNHKCISEQTWSEPARRARRGGLRRRTTGNDLIVLMTGSALRTASRSPASGGSSVSCMINPSATSACVFDTRAKSCRGRQKTAQLRKSSTGPWSRFLEQDYLSLGCTVGVVVFGNIFLGWWGRRSETESTRLRDHDIIVIVLASRKKARTGTTTTTSKRKLSAHGGPGCAS